MMAHVIFAWMMIVVVSAIIAVWLINILCSIQKKMTALVMGCCFLLFIASLMSYRFELIEMDDVWWIALWSIFFFGWAICLVCLLSSEETKKDRSIDRERRNLNGTKEDTQMGK